MTMTPGPGTIRSLTAACLLGTTLAFARIPAPAASPEPAPPAVSPAPSPSPTPSPVSGIRAKISAGDLLSAESILETHGAAHEEDGPYLVGLSWLARGALLIGDTEKASRYAADVRARCVARTAQGAGVTKDHDTEIAFGAAIEVEAQLLARSSGAPRAAELLRRELANLEGPVALRSRLYKRLNMLTLAGTAAPELAVEDFVGEPPPSLASLRGKPVLMFLWAQGCGDCKAQAATLARVKARHAQDGLQVIAISRYYDEPADRRREKARVDSVWTAAYHDVGPVPIVISTESMERYGGSSTPTFVFVDRAGTVRGYTPTRLTEAELDHWLAPVLR